MTTQERKLRSALKEAREVLSLCRTPRYNGHIYQGHYLPEVAAIKAYAHLGYGALMSAASSEWARTTDETSLAGSQHTCGPCEATVIVTLAKIDEALGPQRKKPKGKSRVSR